MATSIPVTPAPTTNNPTTSSDNVELRYPNSAITDTTDYFRLDIIEYDTIKVGEGYVRTTAAFDANILSSKSAKTLTGSIILPMPSGIQDSNSVSYADDSINSIAAKGVSALGDVFNNISIKDQQAKNDKVLNTVEGILGGLPELRGLINKAIAAEAVNVFNANVSVDQLLARSTGQIFNPNMELLFNGVTLRSFKYSFKMTPRDEKEAKSIRAIIKTLKTDMSPQAASQGNITNLYLKTPKVFQPSFRKGPNIHPFLNLFKICALTDMSVNYTGENVYATYSDGSPVSYTMDLTFKELEPIYSSDYSISGTEETVGF